jgi:hypothetical protein
MMIHPKKKLLDKVRQESRDAEMLALAQRIAKHQASGIHRTVDKKLLEKTAKRLQRTPDVVRGMKCDPREN